MTTAIDALTERVLASFDASPSPRLREILRSLVAHLHAFATEVRLTEAEWAIAIEFLTRVGQISNDRRNEAILLSDVLGLSMLVVGLEHAASGRATPSTVLGPFFVEGSPEFALGDDISGGAPGSPCFYSGRVLSSTGEPVAGARMELWHSDESGHYDVQYEGLSTAQGRGHLHTGSEGRYAFSSVLPSAYPIPDDGPVGQLLAASRRGIMRPAHMHFRISAPGFVTLTTQLYVAGDPYLGRDAVFGERDELVSEFVRHEPGPAPDGRVLDMPFHTASYDFVLAPG
jgi:hydroxyquinol 1,2-dioxygenase